MLRLDGMIVDTDSIDMLRPGLGLDLIGHVGEEEKEVSAQGAVLWGCLDS